MTDHPAIIPHSACPQAGSGPHVVVIGGGASGVLMAVHLLAEQDRKVRVTLIEGRNAPGQGLAYSTSDPDHLLNTRVHNMSAFPDDPEHFLRWLQEQPSQAPVTGQCFVSRKVYGRYLADLMTPWLGGAEPQRLRVVQDAAVRVQDNARGVVVHLGGGHSIIGDIAIRFVLRLAEDLDLTGLWGFQYSLTCSRPRLDAFGGGAHVVDLGARKSIGWTSSHEWLAAALNGEDADA